MHKQLHVYFSGRVQGVGFRFTAIRLANSLGIKGWVKNLDDARVEVLAEGAEDSLTSFLEKLKDSFSRYIDETEVSWREATGKFKGFEIEF